MAKLVVNISEGTIDIEGDEKFVLEAFASVRSALKEIEPAAIGKPSAGAEQVSGGDSGALTKDGPSPSKPKPPVAKPSLSTKKAQPALNTSLNLSGLPDYIEKYKPKNNPEKILTFCSFLVDLSGGSACSMDDIYSCFHKMKSVMKIPEAFAKNMNDAKSEGYVDYSKLSEISITTMGINHLVDMSKKVSS